MNTVDAWLCWWDGERWAFAPGKRLKTEALRSKRYWTTIVPQTKPAILVCDNLHTRTLRTLYEPLPPADAYRLA
ncbi:hypothetical protein THTE_3555 [Thermogutta terrifontis]|uniref:Uncharacterized protein n=1 Tax=Thermogutta terrifontis TaxID=1331910 RepID=A0A286RJM7_9BACT|nr:hypothetical protein THTE_3555 [Thermogutta terrifontis]